MSLDLAAFVSSLLAAGGVNKAMARVLAAIIFAFNHLEASRTLRRALGQLSVTIVPSGRR